MGFCDKLKKINMKCTSCHENGIGACHVNVGMQEYYPKDFALYDLVQIIRHDHRLTVETDIEVKYKTEYPYGLFAGKGPQFATEYSGKEKEMRDYLEPKLPPGVTMLRSHQHYKPDLYDPTIVAIHIHIHKSVEDLDEAKYLVEQLAKIIKPPEIEKVLE